MTHAIMSNTDYKGICDTVRAKTETTALLKSAEVAPAIRSIELSTTSLTLTVTTEAGATVTATKGSLSVSAVATNGTAVLKLKEAGDWTVTASLGGETSTVLVSVTDSYEISLSYAVEVNYTGTYADETVQMSDGTYRLLTLSGSGTLTFGQPTVCDIWLCGGGAAGSATTGSSRGAGGGGGGYVANLASQTVQSLIIEIGAGGEGVKAANGNSGSGTSISGDASASVNGGSYANGTAGGAGGSGGGGGYYSSSTLGEKGVGAGESTRPFLDGSQLPYAGGGGGGCYTSKKSGNGGSNGSDGEAGSLGAGSGGYGGYYGGGDGGNAGGSSASGAGGKAATAYGGGGGGATSGSSYYGGSGYQGCVMVRIKLSA